MSLLDVPTERGLSQVYLRLEGPKAGQLIILPSDDYYTDQTQMTRAQALELAAALIRIWTPREELPPSSGGAG